MPASAKTIEKNLIIGIKEENLHLTHYLYLSQFWKRLMLLEFLAYISKKIFLKMKQGN